MKARLVQFGTLTAFAVAAIAPHSALLAQGTQPALPQVQLAFGYQCDDKFLIRNDGNDQVTVEYGLTGAQQRSSVMLKAKESAELTSVAPSAVELWVGGRMVATEQKGNRSCAADQANAAGAATSGGAAGNEPEAPAVIVRPLVDPDYAASAQAYPQANGQAYPQPYGQAYVQPYDQSAYYAPRVVVVPAFPQYAYRAPSVVVRPIISGYGVGTFGREFRGGPVGRVEQIGGGRPAPSRVDVAPRRPVQQFFTGGRERQVQAPRGGWERQGQPSHGREREVQQHSSGSRSGQSSGHAHDSKGDRGRSHHK